MSWTSKSFHVVTSPPLIYDAFQSGDGRRGARKNSGPSGAGTGGAVPPLPQPLFNNPFHTAGSHYARPCQWVSLYALHLFDNTAGWGGIKALTAFIVEPFLQAGRLK